MKFKDKLLNITDAEYRDLPAFSYSFLKAIDDEGPGAFLDRQKISGEALDFGSYVDMLLTNPDSKDELFHTEAVTKPTASLLQLADALIFDSNILDYSYDVITSDEYVENKIKELGLWSNITDNNKVKSKYQEDLFYNYIKNSLDARGKIILSPEVLESATYCATVLQTHDYTRRFFADSDDVEILKQAIILYIFKGVQGKAKIDLIRVDHKNKLIDVFDIKTGRHLPSKFEDAFYEYKYYLQVISYLFAVNSIVINNPEFGDYRIGEFKFIYSSKKMPDTPVVWTVSESLLDSFANGWGGQKGFIELVDEYKHYSETQLFNTEKIVSDNTGLFKIQLR